MRSILPFLHKNEPPLPVVLSPEQDAFNALSFNRAMRRIVDRGLPVETVIDVGASDGRWSRGCEEFFPEARYVLIDAMKIHWPSLEAFCSSRPHASYVKAAASSDIGVVRFFDNGDLFGGVATYQSSGEHLIEVSATTIDNEAMQSKSIGPYFIKLDTHGFEVPILKGAAETLSKASLIQIEVYNFRLRPDALMLDEMIAYMRGIGFGMIDLSEPLWRSHDNAFWQIDAFFIPLSSDLFKHTGY